MSAPAAAVGVGVFALALAGFHSVRFEQRRKDEEEVQMKIRTLEDQLIQTNQLLKQSNLKLNEAMRKLRARQ